MPRLSWQTKKETGALSMSGDSPSPTRQQERLATPLRLARHLSSVYSNGYVRERVGRRNRAGQLGRSDASLFTAIVNDMQWCRGVCTARVVHKVRSLLIATVLD